MIRTLIEVSDEDEWNHKRKLEDILGRLGFEPKSSADHTRFMSDFHAALQEKGIVPHELVDAYRAAKKITA